MSDVPGWLRPVAEAYASISAAQLSPRVPAPPADARESAVLMLLGHGPAGPDLVLTERAHSLRSHPGQVSFPGGRRDEADPDAAACALREAREEIGLDPATVELLGALPPLWIPPSNSAVTTVLGWWRAPHPVDVVDTAEVARVLRVPVAALVDPAARFTVVGPGGWRGPGFDLDGGLVLWGFTAGVVARVLDHVGWSVPWDEGVERDPPRPGEPRRDPVA